MQKIKFQIDGIEVAAKSGQTILEAADQAGIYIPRLCYAKDLTTSHGSCRICTVMVNGRPQTACTQPVADGDQVDNSSEAVLKIRRALVDMLFVEGNHFCPSCEKSGNCELQALAYRLGIAAPQYPFLWPKREVDASHPEVLIDRNRCVLCARCINASKDLDEKNVFQFVGRGTEKRIAVNAQANLSESKLTSDDQAAKICPVGAIIIKHQGFSVPVGQRAYDNAPIGSDIDSKQA
jgi:[NiFe] hydrogenase diaphorase moiety small subunit